MILALVLAAVALADPLALRTAGPARSATAVAGWPVASAGAWADDRWGLALGSTEGASVALAGARRWRLAGADTGWACEATVSAGPTVPLLTPGLALEVGATLAGSHRGERAAWTGSLAVLPARRVLGPSALPAAETRLPVLLGTSAAWRVGPLWLGPLAEAGPVLSPGRPAAVTGRLGLVLSGVTSS